MKVLNITNGDDAANIIKQSSVIGDVLPWRDPMHHGPFPARLSLSQLSALRAGYLAGPGVDSTDVERDFQLRDQHLKAAANYDKVTLWFEHDLLDQLQIVQILDWFSKTSLENTTLAMICIDQFPGKPDFRGIGQLTAEQMATLTDHRHPVTSCMLELAVTAWEAFRSSNPSDLLLYLDRDLSGLPFLAAALHRHIEQFPDATTGLNRTETQVLGLIAESVQSPGQLFVQNMEMEKVLFLGDWSTYKVIDDLCTSGLAVCEPGPFRYPSLSSGEPSEFRAQRLRLTEMGCKVLDKKEDAFGLMKRDGWLGGVELTASRATWAWDKIAENFVRRAA